MRNLKSFKQINLLLFAVMIVFIGCKKEEDPDATALAGTWTVVSFDDNVLNTKVTKTDSNTWPAYNNGDITVSFEFNGTSGGMISGINVTNTFTGSFEVNASSEIAIKDVLSTMINEPEWGRLFDDIESAESFWVSGNTLKIFFNQKQSSITLVRN